uniref:Transmembrane serine protease 2 n=1 Tax=Tetraodon nigroviridis TaxID=99883 RepID=H3CCZ6_TETNG
MCVTSDWKRRCVKLGVTSVTSLLLLLLLAGVLLAYYSSSACIHGVPCGDGSCVWESQWCDGLRHCPAGQDEADCVRLHGSRSVLQIYASGGWRSVCSQGWSARQARASCLELGYSRSFHAAAVCAQVCVTDRAAATSVWLRLQPLRLSSNSDACPGDSVVTLQCTDCGRGVNSSGGAWPWQVSLQLAGSHRCGGAIVSPYWLVTAACCVAREPRPAAWTVYTITANALRPLFAPARFVSRVLVHEGYNQHSQANDIALLRLAEALDLTDGSLVPVCLPNAGLNISQQQPGWISHLRPSGSGSLALAAERVSILDGVECNRSPQYRGRVGPDMLCAQGTSAAACQAESGSPLVTLEDGVWWLIGESIWAERCTEHNTGVHGNISYFQAWIRQQMK